MIKKIKEFEKLSKLLNPEKEASKKQLLKIQEVHNQNMSCDIDWRFRLY